MPLYNFDQDVQVGGSNSCRNEIRSRGTNSDGDEPLVIVKKTRQPKVTMSSMNSHATPHIYTNYVGYPLGTLFIFLFLLYRNVGV